jgi:glycosyltransferase involved in cell wall biosynthesis
MDISDFVKQLNSVISAAPVATVTDVTTMSDAVEPKKEMIQKKLKLLIVSTHTNQINGYSKVIYNIIKELGKNDWIDIVHFGTQKLAGGDLGRKYPMGVKVIDATSLEKQKTAGFAFSELPAIIHSENPDIVFIYNDIAVISGYIEEIRKHIQNRFFKIWAYIDMVYQSQPQAMLDIINRDVERIFCFNKHWKDQIKAQGITRPVDIISHGVDPAVFRSIPRDLARQTLGLPKDVFLFSSFNRNIPRKRLDILIMSFVQLIVKYPTKMIFMLIVADKGDKGGGYQLFEIFARELQLAKASVDVFGNRLLITTTNSCYKDDDVNLLYNCADVGVSCAEGEGFGLCTFEQMGCGIPQIVPEIGGYTEYCNENNALLVKPKVRYYIPQTFNIVTGEAQMVASDDVAKAMERYVFDEDLRKLHGKLGKETVLEYTWEKACSTLIKRLKIRYEDNDD